MPDFRLTITFPAANQDEAVDLALAAIEQLADWDDELLGKFTYHVVPVQPIETDTETDTETEPARS